MIPAFNDPHDILTYCMIDTACPFNEPGSTLSGYKLVCAGEMFCNGGIDTGLVIASVHRNPIVFVVDLYSG